MITLQTIIWDALEAAGSAGRTLEDLIIVAYRGCRMPLCADAVIRAQIQRLRRAVAALGLTIAYSGKRCARGGVYRIVPLQEVTAE